MMAKLCLTRKINCCIVIFLLVIGSYSHAQLNPPMGTSPWKFTNPLQHGYNMNDMSFINDNVGLAVGENGGLARTTDGGRNWQSLPFKFVTPSNTIAVPTFNDVHFVTPTIAYAVGTQGLMIKSTDGGITWNTVSNPLYYTNKNINGLHFLNKDTGYIGGQALLSSASSSSPDAAPKVYFTKNGGATWDSLVSPFRPAQNNTAVSGFNTTEILRIHFVNDSVGYICGSANANGNLSAILWKYEKGVLKDYSLHRTKFGITAATGAAGNHPPSTQSYKALLGINDSLVLLASLNNNIIMRVRTGKNDSTANAVPAIYGAYERGKYEVIVWLNSTATPFPSSLSTVAGQGFHLKKGPGNKIFATQGNAVIFTTDNGDTWGYSKPTPTTVNYAHWGAQALDITPNGRIVVGMRNGLTWDSLPGSPWQSTYKNLRPLFFSFTDMDWADCNNGVIVGTSGTILKTNDGGKTWINNSSPVFEASQTGLGVVRYPSVNTMFFSTFNSVYKSIDQGSTNDVIFTEPNINGGINAFTTVGTDRAFAAGYRFSPVVERTVIFRTLNANAASPVWDTVKTFPVGNLAPQPRSIKFANQDTGYISFNRGKVYRTIDGGATWVDKSPDTLAFATTTANYTALSVVNGKTIYVGGNNRRLFRSTDAGETWTDITIAVPAGPSPITAFSTWNNIIMNDALSGYIQSSSTIMKTTDGWASWTYDVSPMGVQNISIYPKIPGPLDSKKLYVMHTVPGFGGGISTQTASMMEYGNATLYTMSTSETVVNATCTNPSAGSITVTPVGGIAPYSYSINGGAFQSTNVFTGLTQGVKNLIIKDAGCETITKSVTVGFDNNLTLTVNRDTVVCAGAPVPMLATANGATATYAWSPATGLSSTSINNPVATVNSNAAFTVTASLNGCTQSKTVNIGIKANPVISAGADKTIVIGDEVQLQGSATNFVTIAWSPANTLSNANSFTPIAKPTTTTTYTLSVVNNNNCTSTDQVVITVLTNCLNVMNAFTPNGDGANDLWLVTSGSACTKQVSVAVFNRYGNTVYKNDNYQNDWNGNYNGKPVADGTYYYNVTYKTIAGKTITLKGDVTILR